MIYTIFDNCIILLLLIAGLFFGEEAALLIITHNAAILSALHVDRVHVLVDGRIAAEGGPELIDEIGCNGFSAYEGDQA